MIATTITAISILLATALAAPAPSHTIQRRQQNPVAIMESIAPNSNTCANAPIASECATATDAVGPIISSFALCSIATAAEQAALLAWMSYESADFKYNQNHFPAPGNPGQGTRTMMSPTFVAEYVKFLGLSTTSTDPATILALVQPNQYSFGSAAWFYHTQCSEDVKTQLKTGTQDGFANFLTACVGTTVDEGSGATSRLAYWQRATTALGV